MVSVERAAIDGDTVIIDFEGFRDGEVFEGGSGEGTSLELGFGAHDPWIRGRIDWRQCRGRKAAQADVPGGLSKRGSAGADVEFKVSVSEVQELELAAVDSALFASTAWKRARKTISGPK